MQGTIEGAETALRFAYGNCGDAEKSGISGKERIMTIRFYVTGGTFDKEYNEITGELFFRDTHVREMLKMGRCNLDLEIRTLMMIDSTEMTDVDREMIRKACAESSQDRIVITHGTDTMADTARHLGEKVKDKTIVLVGAMIPFTFGSSDGLFNLGAALAFAQTLPHGVYVAMNGRLFQQDNVRKNRSTGLFEVVQPE